MASGCYTGVPPTQGGAQTDGLGFEDDTGGDPDDGAGDGDESGEPDDPPPPPLSVLPSRRLTRVQFDNVVADLLGDTTQPSLGLPADSEAYGYASNGEGDQVSLLAAEQYETVAAEVAARAVLNPYVLLGCDQASIGCIDGFIERFGSRAFRRPLSTTEAERLAELYGTALLTHGADKALELLVQAVLLSPKFLYRIEVTDADGRVDDWTMASRLSFLLWNTMPDHALLDAAADGTLSTAEGVRAHAERMLDDRRAEPMVLDFHRQWLLLDWLFTAAKDPAVFPTFDEDLQHRLAEETEAFIADAVLTGDGTLSSLLTDSATFLDGPLAAHYGLPAPAAPEVLTRVALDPTRAAGFLTQGAFLAAHSSSNTTSPVRRGKFVRERLLCGKVPPPPPGLDTDPPVPTPGSTTRERYEQHSTDPVCAACHDMMDPIGLGFEHYDAIGRWRDLEGGREIDATIELIGVDDQTNGTVDGVVELAHRLADSPTTRNCVARQWFRYAYGRDDYADAYSDTIAALQADFDGDIQALIIAITQTDLFLGGRLP